jgi:phytoene synthase
MRSMPQPEQEIFRAGSATFYRAAWFFPKSVRQDVALLYGFLRLADDYADASPPQTTRFNALYNYWRNALAGNVKSPTSADQRVAAHIVQLSKTYHFDPTWLTAFWQAMRSDLQPTMFHSLDQTLRYVHGSAEVVGLMMAKLMQLPKEAYPAAELQGRAFQWINFIRDIAEDTVHGRCYFPNSDLQAFGLSDLGEQTAKACPQEFVQFMRFQIDRYHDWQRQATAGHHYLPRRLRPAIRTAVAMYDWTAAQIAADPAVVFRQTVRPSKSRILLHGLRYWAAPPATIRPSALDRYARQ